MGCPPVTLSEDRRVSPQLLSSVCCLPPASSPVSQTHTGLHPCCPLGPTAKSLSKPLTLVTTFPFSGSLHPPSSATAPSGKSPRSLASFLALVSMSLQLHYQLSQPFSPLPSYTLLRVTKHRTRFAQDCHMDASWGTEAHQMGILTPLFSLQFHTQEQSCHYPRS